jgi:hypothetical protein
MHGFFSTRQAESAEAAPRRVRSRGELLQHETSSLHDYSFDAVLARIETSFDALEAGKISIATFEKVVRAEHGALLALAPAEPLEGGAASDGVCDFEIFDIVTSDWNSAIALVERSLSWVESYQAQISDDPENTERV